MAILPPDKMTVHVHADEKLIEALKEAGAETRKLRAEIADMHASLDFWVARVQQLENLPGVPGALRAMQSVDRGAMQ